MHYLVEPHTLSHEVSTFIYIYIYILMIEYYDSLTHSLSLSLSLSHFMEDKHEIIPPMLQTFDYRKQNILVPVHHLEITHCIYIYIYIYIT